jgi:hypothetical protein
MLWEFRHIQEFRHVAFRLLLPECKDALRILCKLARHCIFLWLPRAPRLNNNIDAISLTANPSKIVVLVSAGGAESSRPLL